MDSRTSSLVLDVLKPIELGASTIFVAIVDAQGASAYIARALWLLFFR